MSDQKTAEELFMSGQMTAQELFDAPLPPPSNPSDPLYKDILGYPRIAARMALNPSTASFRRFSALQARNLLYMQSELCSLERKLRAQEAIDSASENPDKKKYATNAGFLRLGMLDEEDGLSKQLELLGKIQRKLKEYNKALHHFRKTINLPSPDAFDLNDHQHFLNNIELMGIWSMSGEDSNVWGSIIHPDDTAPDLAALVPRIETDPFSGWLSDNAIHLFKFVLGRFTTPNKKDGSVGYYESTVFMLTFWLVMVLASIVPVAGVWALVGGERDEHMKAMAGINLAACAVLGVFTRPRRSEVFCFTVLLTLLQVVVLRVGL